MQFLIFHLGADRYCLPTRDVVRVLPLMALRPVPGAPPAIAGMMNLHGSVVPVLDLCQLSCGRACAAQFDTRILLVSWNAATGPLPLGLVAERVIGVRDLDAEGFAGMPLAHPAAPWLGRVSPDPEGVLQLVEPARLLDAELCALLYPGDGVHR